MTYFVTALGVLGDTESDKDRISHSDEDIVYTVYVDILDAALVHVVEYTTDVESAVESSIAICSR